MNKFLEMMELLLAQPEEYKVHIGGVGSVFMILVEDNEGEDILSVTGFTVESLFEDFCDRVEEIL